VHGRKLAVKALKAARPVRRTNLLTPCLRKKFLDWVPEIFAMRASGVQFCNSGKF
jgi:hypothetical protein